MMNENYIDENLYEKMFAFGLKLAKEKYAFHFEGVDDIEFVFTLYSNDNSPIQVRFIHGYGVNVLIGYDDLLFLPYGEPEKFIRASFSPFDDVDGLISYLKELKPQNMLD